MMGGGGKAGRNLHSLYMGRAHLALPFASFGDHNTAQQHPFGHASSF